MPTYRVVGWSTGGLGSIAVRAITRHPDLELAGVWVHDQDKIGRDVGDLVDIGPIGMSASSDVDYLLNLHPDCVCYTATGEPRPTETIDDFCRILGAGINVVTTSSPGLLYPSGFSVKQIRRIEASCREGQATLYASGIEPGFAGDHLILLLSTLSNKIHSVRTQELFNYESVPARFTIFDLFGFGMPLDHRC